MVRCCNPRFILCSPQVCKVYVGSFNSDAPIREVGRSCQEPVGGHEPMGGHELGEQGGGRERVKPMRVIHLCIPFPPSYTP